MAAAFADRFVQSARRLGHPLCVGIDPHLGLIPPAFRAGAMAPGAPDTAAAVERWCLALLDRVAGRVAVVKPQSAFFEALGPAGAAVLARVIAEARARGLLVLLDAKRGDVGSTAEAYAAAYLRRLRRSPATRSRSTPTSGSTRSSPSVRPPLAVARGCSWCCAPAIRVRATSRICPHRRGRSTSAWPRRSAPRPPHCGGPRRSGRASAWWWARPGPSRAGACARSCREACSWCRATTPREAVRRTPWPASCPGPMGASKEAWSRPRVPSASRAEGRAGDAAGWERGVDRALDAAIEELTSASSGR